MQLSKRSIGKGLLSFFYPTFCLHCEEKILPLTSPLCPACTQQLELLSKTGRCPRCMSFQDRASVCSACAKRPPYFHRHIASFDKMGPAYSLCLKYSQNGVFLARSLASFMAAQYLQMDLPLPDFLIPLPSSMSEKLFHGGGREMLLAHEISKVFSRPVLSALKYEWDEGRELCSFRESTGMKIGDKVLLLVALQFDRERLEQAAKELRKGFPEKIYILSFVL